MWANCRVQSDMNLMRDGAWLLARLDEKRHHSGNFICTSGWSENALWPHVLPSVPAAKRNIGRRAWRSTRFGRKTTGNSSRSQRLLGAKRCSSPTLTHAHFFLMHYTYVQYAQSSHSLMLSSFMERHRLLMNWYWKVYPSSDVLSGNEHKWQYAKRHLRAFHDPAPLNATLAAFANAALWSSALKLLEVSPAELPGWNAVSWSKNHSTWNVNAMSGEKYLIIASLNSYILSEILASLRFLEICSQFLLFMVTASFEREQFPSKRRCESPQKWPGRTCSERNISMSPEAIFHLPWI